MGDSILKRNLLNFQKIQYGGMQMYLFLDKLQIFCELKTQKSFIHPLFVALHIV